MFQQVTADDDALSKSETERLIPLWPVHWVKPQVLELLPLCNPLRYVHSENPSGRPTDFGQWLNDRTDEREVIWPVFSTRIEQPRDMT